MSGNNGTEEFGPATGYDVVLPPAMFLVIFVLGILLFSIYTQPHWWLHLCRLSKHNKLHEFGAPDNNLFNNQRLLLQSKDSKIINNFKRFQNSPWPLIKLSLPCILSVAFCPFTLYSAPHVSEFFYPKRFGDMPVVNDVVQAFLMPAGLVYAIAFGFALQNALQSQEDSMQCLSMLVTLLRHCTGIIERLSLSKEDKMSMIACLKDWVVNWMQEIVTGKTDPFREGLWRISDILRQEENRRVCNKDERFVNELFTKLFELDSLLAKCHNAAHPSINLVLWIFLELLGFISFFGILMVRASSYRLELTLCMLTVFTISIFAYILADIDSPYHGFFRVDLSVFVKYMEKQDERYYTQYVRTSVKTNQNGHSLDVLNL